MAYAPHYKQQNEILRWLESLGHEVDFGSGKKAIGSSKGHRDWREWQMCKRKRRFETMPEENATRRVYSCPYCMGWHFTRK